MEFKVGTRVRIEGTIFGCKGAEGLCGEITNEENGSGLLSRDSGVNVKTDHNWVWRVNKEAVKKEGGATAKIEIHSCDGSKIDEIEVGDGQIVVVQYHERVTLQQMDHLNESIKKAFESSQRQEMSGILHMPHYATIKLMTIREEGERVSD